MTTPFDAYDHCTRCYQRNGLLTTLVVPGPDWCHPCQRADSAQYIETVMRHRPHQAAKDQTDDAIELLNRPVSDFLRWPFQPFAEYPALTPGSVSIFAAGSGIGKTTAMLSMIQRWMAAGVGCYVLPLESKPRTFRVGMLCHEMGIHAGQALTGELQRREAAGDPIAAAQREALKRALKASPDDAVMLQRLYVASERSITATKLMKAASHARALGLDVLIVDHVDHVGDDQEDRPTNAIQESKKVLHMALDAALRYDLKVILTSQLNSSGSRVDRLARFAPPQLEHLLLHTYKVQVAEQIWAAYRPLDPMATPGMLTAARAGTLESWKVLWPNRSGLISLKIRNDIGMSGHEGGRVILAYADGVLRERTDTEIFQDGLREKHTDGPQIQVQ